MSWWRYRALSASVRTLARGVEQSKLVFRVFGPAPVGTARNSREAGACDDDDAACKADGTVFLECIQEAAS